MKAIDPLWSHLVFMLFVLKSQRQILAAGPSLAVNGSSVCAGVADQRLDGLIGYKRGRFEL